MPSPNRRPRRMRDAPTAPEPFKALRRAYPPIAVLSAEEEARIHALSLRLLEEVGLKFLSPETWDILERNGCSVDRETGMTQLPAEVIEHFLALAPAAFTMRARNPAHDLHFGGEEIHYGSASSAPNVIDADRGRRPGTQADFEALVRLNQMLPTCAFHSGHPVEPIDTPANTRHLTSSLAWHTLSDKVTRIYAIGRVRARDSIEIMRIAHGLDEDGARASPRLHASINVNSPLVVDAPLIEGAMEMGAWGQACVVSPVAFAGAMSPITLSGSIIQC
ncbi:MAG: trimethylamine methyltransferase family protein, partial [Pseudomonadota bacterium]